VERKWKERYPQKFRCRAVERMNACDNIVRLTRERGVSRSLLYKWRHRLEVLNGQTQSEATIRNSRESTLRDPREVLDTVAISEDHDDKVYHVAGCSHLVGKVEVSLGEGRNP
jgi:transposase-like protein